ncbi:hypothetical protein LSTR_LSTR009278, partial [Laodelphax striatellus]
MANKGAIPRESSRLKDSNQKLVLDEATRSSRAQKALEALEADNSHEDPHLVLVDYKKLPKFEETLDTRGGRKRRLRVQNIINKDS